MRTCLALCFLLACLFAFAAAECYGGSEPEAVDDPAICKWYAGNTCCPSTEGGDGGDGDEASSPCKEPSQGCLDQLGLLMCAECSPDSASFMKLPDGSPYIKTYVCADFADKFYDSCKNDEITTDGETCKKIGDEWEDSEDLFTNSPYSAQFARVDGDTDCFNAAGVMKPIAAIIALFVVVAAF